MVGLIYGDEAKLYKTAAKLAGAWFAAELTGMAMVYAILFTRLI